METTLDLQELLVNDRPGAVNNHIDVTQRLKAIWIVQGKIEELKQMKRDYAAFYDDRIRKAEDNIDFLKGQIEAFMLNTKTKTVPTPAGTVSYTLRKQVLWPDDDQLLAFSKEMGLPVKVTERPIKTEIAAHIKETGTKPPGYVVHEVPGLTIRSPKEDQTDEGGDGW
jgi:hypothetical protein